jgi:hypothetical protein
LPYVVQILQCGVSIEIEVRYTCVEILTHLAYTRRRYREVAEALSQELVDTLLQDKGSKNTLNAACQGKALLSRDDHLSAEKLTSINSLSGMDLQPDLQRICANSRSCSVGMRHFGEIVRRSTMCTQQSESTLSNNVDGNLFNVGLLMANLSAEFVPGTELTFAEVAQPFWKRTLFFAVLGICLDAVLKGEPWPPLHDGEHKPLHLVSTCVKLVTAGYARKLASMVESLAAVLGLCSPNVDSPALTTRLRIGRLASVALRGIVDESKTARNDLRRLIQEQGGGKFLAAMEALSKEEPAAGDLFVMYNWSTSSDASPNRTTPSLSQKGSPACSPVSSPVRSRCTSRAEMLSTSSSESDLEVLEEDDEEDDDP